MTKAFKVLLIFVLTSIMCHSQSNNNYEKPIIPRQTRLYYGFQLKEGFNLLLSQPKWDNYAFLSGTRFHPSFSLYIELGQWYALEDYFRGLSLELQYSYRGGKIKKNILNPPAMLSIDYLDLRIGYSSNSQDVGFGRCGLELSFLTNATYTDAAIPLYNVEDEVSKRCIGAWVEAGWRLGNHITLCFFVDWLFWGLSEENDDLLNEYFWDIPSDDQNINIGITLGWQFKPIVLGSNIK